LSALKAAITSSGLFPLYILHFQRTLPTLASGSLNPEYLSQQEGQFWEASMYAAHNKIDNLNATIDYNGQQIDGSCERYSGFKEPESQVGIFRLGSAGYYGNNLKK